MYDKKGDTEAIAALARNDPDVFPFVIIVFSAIISNFHLSRMPCKVASSILSLHLTPLDAPLAGIEALLAALVEPDRNPE